MTRRAPWQVNGRPSGAAPPPLSRPPRGQSSPINPQTKAPATFSSLDYVEERGVEKGVQQGKLQGQRQMIRELLEARFGPLSPSVLAKLESWPGDRLRELGRALVSADSLEQLGFIRKLRT